MMRTASLLLLAVLFGCGEPPAPVGATLSATSSDGTFEAHVTPQVVSIPLNEPFAVTLALVDPVTGATFTDYDKVTIDARMPAHGHGMLRYVDLQPAGDGAMRAEGFLFHMVGHWEIHVDVYRGPRIERAQISVSLEF